EAHAARGQSPGERKVSEKNMSCYCARSTFFIIFLLNGIQENIYLSCVANNFKAVFVSKSSKNLLFAHRTCCPESHPSHLSLKLKSFLNLRRGERTFKDARTAEYTGAIPKTVCPSLPIKPSVRAVRFQISVPFVSILRMIKRSIEELLAWVRGTRKISPGQQIHLPSPHSKSSQKTYRTKTIEDISIDSTFPSKMRLYQAGQFLVSPR
ncbi:MAG: hypothetical protein LUP97_04555, partial [Methanoregula sp.]|nr:hypothetical protein [Methanoregula sp.]